jgi:hypothetical protein
VSFEERATHWVPEICYEEADDGLTSKIPFIDVPPTEKMPNVLFIFEACETGEFEPGPTGEPIPIVNLDLHQYADMNVLRTGLPQEIYDKVRLVLGLDPLATAIPKGMAITEKVRNNVLGD